MSFNEINLRIFVFHVLAGNQKKIFYSINHQEIKLHFILFPLGDKLQRTDGNYGRMTEGAKLVNLILKRTRREETKV